MISVLKVFPQKNLLIYEDKSIKTLRPHIWNALPEIKKKQKSLSKLQK